MMFTDLPNQIFKACETVNTNIFYLASSCIVYQVIDIDVFF